MRKRNKKTWMILWSLCCCLNISSQNDITAPPADPPAWNVHFKTGSSELLLHFKGNRVTLDQFVAKVNNVANSGKQAITKVRITGYASPEGALELNQRLSQERGEVLRDYLIEKTHFPENKFEVIAGGENWNGLQPLVENSRIKNKQEVLLILASETSKQEKERKLKELSYTTYRFMVDNLYEKLRSASSIQLIKEMPLEGAPLCIAPPKTEGMQQTDRPHLVRPVIPVTEVAQKKERRTIRLGISTNLAYWAAGIIPNIQLETYFASRYSITAEGLYRWSKDQWASHNNVNLAYVSPEFRCYLRNDDSYTGHYFALYGQYGEYDLKLGDSGRQGDYCGAGLSYGYIFRFNRVKNLFFDLGLSMGYGRMDYDSYFWYEPLNAYDGSVERNYWGPTKMKASLIWRF